MIPNSFGIIFIATPTATSLDVLEAQDHLEEIITFPEEYVEFWDLEEWEGVTAAMLCELEEELNLQVEKVQATPRGERGNQGND